MSIFKLTLSVSMIVLSACMLLAMIRFLRGPSLPDRITAYDLFSAILIAILAIFAEYTEDDAYLDVAIILSIFAFLGAISFAYYLIKK